MLTMLTPIMMLLMAIIMAKMMMMLMMVMVMIMTVMMMLLLMMLITSCHSWIQESRISRLAPPLPTIKSEVNEYSYTFYTRGWCVTLVMTICTR
jgi:hypothetical protein